MLTFGTIYFRTLELPTRANGEPPRYKAKRGKQINKILSNMAIQIPALRRFLFAKVSVGFQVSRNSEVSLPKGTFPENRTRCRSFGVFARFRWLLHESSDQHSCNYVLSVSRAPVEEQD
jgi:hypothetical protein